MEDDTDSQKSQVEYRWGHSEGITAIDCCAVGEGGNEKLVTCGADSDLRVWKGFDDDDPTAHELTDNGLTLICGKNGEVFVGTEYNTVETLSLEDGKNLGVKAKFTAPVNHIDLSADGKWLVAGSGDMKIQLINLEDSSILPVTIDTHTAPVLSVALDPLKEFLASSGCDGSVCVWSLTEEGKPVNMVKKLENVFPSSNDITTSSTLCRMAWEDKGKILAVPETDHIALYARDSWAKLKVLRSQKSKKIASVAKFSKCGSYLAAGGSDGSLTVWNVSDSKVLMERAQFSDQITGIIYANKESDIIAADCKGRILLLKDFKSQTVSKSGADAQQEQSSKSNDDIGDDVGDTEISSPPEHSEPNDTDVDAFDDGMDDLFADDIEEDNEISISKIKAATGFIGEEYVGVKKAAKIILGGDLNDKGDSKSDDDDDAASDSSSIPRSRQRKAATPPPPPREVPITKPQGPFQPASTPALKDNDHRFMIWNTTGIIRSYSYDDGEKRHAIDVEFHDAAVHAAIHMRNDSQYTIATLTTEVAVFANGRRSDAGSTLYCRYFASWDGITEWNTELPLGEEIVGLAAGDGWIAASTNMNRIRLFTIGGAQKQVIEIAGQIIATSGHEDLLFITFHNGIGLQGNQCIAHSIFRIKPSLKPFPLVSCEPLPLSPKSQLLWIGFTDEGTPLTADSRNILRILSGRYWTTFCALKDQLHAGSTDYFWVVGVSELDQRIRAVKCKGTRYPMTLPKPVVMHVDAQLPLCEMETEKSRLEDKLHRSLMLDALSKKMDKKNYDVDDYKQKAGKDLKECLFTLFTLSCAGNWEARGAEYVTMMPSAHAVQVAVKYASKLRKNALVTRLTAIGRKKLDEEDLEDEGDDDDFETLKMGTVVYSHVQNRSLAADYSASQDLFPEPSGSRSNQTSIFSTLSNSFAENNRPISIADEDNPFLKNSKEEIRKLLLSDNTPTSNKFRKDKPENTENGSGKGLSVIDSWKKPAEKQTDMFAKTVTRNSKGGGGRKSAAEKEKSKEQPPNKEKKKQATLLDMGGRKKTRQNSGSGNPTSPAMADIFDESNDSALIENQGSETQNDHIAPNSESLLEDSTNTRHPDQSMEEQPPQAPKGKQGYLLWFDENREALENEHPELGVKELTKIGAQMYRKLSPEEKKRYANPNSDPPKEDKKRKRSEVEEDSESTKERSSEGEKKSKLASKLSAFACSNTD